MNRRLVPPLVRFGAPLLVTVAFLCALPPSALAESALTITPTVADFGRVEPGGTATRYLAVTSSGSEAVELGDLWLDDQAEVFSIDGGSCLDMVVLDPGEGCSLISTFHAPLTHGEFEAALVFEGAVEGDVPGEAVLRAASRSAASIRPGSLVATPGSLSFGATPIRVMTPSQAVTLRNEGETSVAVTGAYGGPHFRLLHTDCVRTIEPEGACTMTIAFQPGSLYGGPLSSDATVRTQQGVIVRVHLTGTAIGPPRPVPPPPPPNYGSIERDLADLADSLPRLMRGGPERWRLLPALEAPTAGRLSLTLFGWNRARRLRIGGGALSYDAPKGDRLKFRLNKKGVALLRRPQRTRIKVVLKFQPVDHVAFRQGSELLVKQPLKKPKRR
jgi:hypothetical protein